MPSYPLVQTGCTHWRACKHLDGMANLDKISQRGYVENIGGIRLDSRVLGILLEEGMKIRTNRISYSMLDRRAESKLIPLARENNVSLLFDSPLADGWLGDEHVDKLRPDYVDLIRLPKSTQISYQLLRKAGGWEFLQALSQTTIALSKKHSEILEEDGIVRPEMVNFQWPLQRARELGVEAGAIYRLEKGRANPIENFIFNLDSDDMQDLDKILDESKRLFPPEGCIGSWEREMQRSEDGNEFFIDKSQVRNRKSS